MPSPTKVQLEGGHFQDASGNILEFGTLRMKLVQDEQLSSSTGQVCGGIDVLISLDVNGSVSVSPIAQYVWPTDVMAPSGASYTVWGYSAEGQLAWGPNYGLLVPSGATFDLDAWVPNSVSTTGGSGLTLQTNGVNNASQSILNLVNGTGITITSDDEGDTTISSSFVAPTQLPITSRYFNLYAVQNAEVLHSFFIGSGIGFVNSGAAFNAATTLQPATLVIGVVASSASQGIYFDAVMVDGNILARSRAMVTALVTTGSPYYEIMCPIIATDQAFNTVTFLSMGNSIGIYADATTANWQAFVTAAGTPTVVDTGIAVVINVPHTFEFSSNFAAGKNFFYIDGILVATIAAMPATTTLLNPGALDSNNYTESGNFRLAQLYFEAY